MLPCLVLSADYVNLFLDKISKKIQKIVMFDDDQIYLDFKQIRSDANVPVKRITSFVQVCL